MSNNCLCFRSTRMLIKYVSVFDVTAAATMQDHLVRSRHLQILQIHTHAVSH